MQRHRSAIFAIIFIAGCGASGDTPGLVVTPGMVASVPFDPYDPNPITPNHMTLLAPPVGTVPVGFSPLPYGPFSPEDAIRAGIELTSPLLPPTAADLARGQQAFDTFCAICHGPGGVGDGPIIGRFPNPPNLMAAPVRQLTDGRIFYSISRGGKIMPSYAVQIQTHDRWRIVAYLRTLQAKAGAPADAPASAPADAPVSAAVGAQADAAPEPASKEAAP